MTFPVATDILLQMRTGLCSILVVLLVSCGPSAIDGGFDSANPAARLYAIENAARTGDVGAARRIVEQLHSDDPAVRMLAIGALQRLTGERHGYDHADSPQLRQAAIVRWRQALDQGDFIQIAHQTDEVLTGTPTDDG